MDARRFDDLTRALAGRLSRRNAFRQAAAVASAGLLSSAGVRAVPVLAQGQDDEPVYTMIRRYTLDGPTSEVRAALQRGYIEDACLAPGFIAYFAVEDEDGDFATVAVFRTQDDFENFASAEATWIAQNLGDLLPAPDEAISGDTYVHVGATEAFRNTCPGQPTPATVAPGAPTPVAPTSVAPTPTPVPAPCTAQGCVCATGTQSPCIAGLVCCPTTDRMGGPGVCQPEAVCYPNQCTSNGNACDPTCSWGDACPSCCSNYCNNTGQCDNPPAPCTGEGCACTTGTQAPCDAGLICCGTTGTPGGPGTCTTEAACTPAPCTGQGCACNGGVQGNCDAGLICCQGVQPILGGVGTCQPTANCAPAPCTGDGCACTTGTQAPCDAGLVCCGQGGGPGGPGICLTEDECSPPCTGQGCACNGGVQGACDDGLICCQTDPSAPGGPGTCQTQDACGPPPCTGIGGGCDATCNLGDSCVGCCSGYCNGNGVCDVAPPPPCTGEGCACTTGTFGPCDDGLSCCQTSDLPGGPGVCQATC